MCSQVAGLDIGRGWITMRHSSESETILEEDEHTIEQVPMHPDHYPQALDRNSKLYSGLMPS